MLAAESRTSSSGVNRAVKPGGHTISRRPPGVSSQATRSSVGLPASVASPRPMPRHAPSRTWSSANCSGSKRATPETTPTSVRDGARSSAGVQPVRIRPRPKQTRAGVCSSQPTLPCGTLHRSIGFESNTGLPSAGVERQSPGLFRNASFTLLCSHFSVRVQVRFCRSSVPFAPGRGVPARTSQIRFRSHSTKTFSAVPRSQLPQSSISPVRGGTNQATSRTRAGSERSKMRRPVAQPGVVRDAALDSGRARFDEHRATGGPDPVRLARAKKTTAGGGPRTPTGRSQPTLPRQNVSRKPSCSVRGAYARFEFCAG